jgi:hypothetical protein
MLLAAAILALLQPAAAADARAVSLAPAVPLVEIDTSKLKGDVAMLAWSPDGTELYLETVERDRQGAVRSTKHYVISTAMISTASRAIKGVDLAPAWATPYWTWKSGQASPAMPTFKIAVDQRQETVHTTAAVGDIAKGGGGSASGTGATPGTSVEEAASISAASQVQQIWSLKVKTELIGEWTNEAVTPGTNFTWAPAPMRLLMYAKRDGGPLMVLDETGRKQALAGAKNATLPAWSGDGTKLAWLEKKDRKRFDLMIAGVTIR